MALIPVAVLNQSTAVTDTEVKNLISALQTQVSRDLAPAWNIDATLSLVVAGQQAPAGSYRLFLKDNTDQGRDTGYHTADADGPFARVFVVSAKAEGQQWTAVASHVADDTGLTNASTASGVSGTYYDLEVCDPVYPDENNYQINGVYVSDFVFPLWFAPWLVPSGQSSAKVDYANKLQWPGDLAPGALLAASFTGRYNINGPTPAAAVAQTRTPSAFVAARAATQKSSDA
jgi:hypothetical protein